MISVKNIFNNVKFPIWIMRQAGRYLPEYLEVRSKTPKFLDLCYNPDLLAKVTMQPIERFDLDAAIIFSDILVILDALKIKVSFEKNHGPIVEKVKKFTEIKKFNQIDFENHLSPIYEGIKKTRNLLPKNKPLIGFVGAPWTVATYLIEGEATKTFNLSKDFAYNNEKEFQKIIDLLTEISIIHLKNQIESGVQIVQIFDSWSGVLNEENFNKWVIKPSKIIVENIKKSFPNTAITGFPKGSGIFYKDYIKETKVDIIGLDSNLPLTWIRENIPKTIITQGMLDPIYLLEKDKGKLKEQILKILYTFDNHNHIFNLGHGILPQTPIENVTILIETIRNYAKKSSNSTV